MPPAAPIPSPTPLIPSGDTSGWISAVLLGFPAVTGTQTSVPAGCVLFTGFWFACLQSRLGPHPAAAGNTAGLVPGRSPALPQQEFLKRRQVLVEFGQLLKQQQKRIGSVNPVQQGRWRDDTDATDATEVLIQGIRLESLSAGEHEG